MDMEILIHTLLLGFGIAYMLILGLYLLLSKKSLFTDNKHLNLSLRRVTGFNVLAWGTTFATGLINYSLEQKYTFDFAGLDLQLDLFLIPLAMWLLFEMVQIGRRRLRFVLPALGVPVVMMIAFVFTQNSNISTGITYYWLAYICFSLGYFLLVRRRYKRKLLENFSDLQNREIRWVNMIIVFFLLYLILYLFGHVGGSRLALYSSYIVCMAMWSYIAWHVDKQEKLDNFWRNYEVEEELISTQAVAVPVKDEHGLSPDVVEHIELQLQTECIEARLFLVPDISLGMLAQAIGTNRTYLSNYLNSKNMTFYSYINSHRIEYALKLLQSREQGMTMEEVSRRSGFNSVSTFRRAFVEKEGCTPAMYIAKMLGRKDLR